MKTLTKILLKTMKKAAFAFCFVAFSVNVNAQNTNPDKSGQVYKDSTAVFKPIDKSLIMREDPGKKLICPTETSLSKDKILMKSDVEKIDIIQDSTYNQNIIKRAIDDSIPVINKSNTQKTSNR